MKAFFILILLAGIGAGGFYVYKHHSDHGKFPWEESAGNTGDGGNGTQESPRDLGTEPASGTGTGGQEPETRTADVPKPDRYAELYPLPKFQSLEEMTDNWKVIPPRAFPREVTTKEAVKLEIPTLPGAGSTLTEGTKMQALGMENGLMVLALDPNSNARAKVPATATSFVDQVRGIYEADQKKQIANIMAQREAAKKRDEATVADSGAGSSSSVASSAAVRAPTSDPRFQPMVDSINAEETQEIRMKNVQSWRWGGKTKVGGQEYDYGLITFSVDTLFGTMDTEAMALIKNGKLHKWIYTGSGEEVPRT